ncbi:MAG: hypothetical protein N2D54_08560, partial [Chloroflexota bacterium]
IPPWLIVSTLLGFVAAIFLHRRFSKHKLSFALSGFLWLIAIILIQQLFAWVRIWIFALPMYLIYASGGIVGLLELLQWQGMQKRLKSSLLVAIILFGFSSILWISTDTLGFRELRGAPNDVHLAAQFVAAQLQPDDLIAVESPDGPAFRYYASFYDVEHEYYNLAGKPFKRVFVIVSRRANQTLERIADNRANIIVFLDMPNAELVFKKNGIRVFLVFHR